MNDEQRAKKVLHPLNTYNFAEVYKRVSAECAIVRNEALEEAAKLAQESQFSSDRDCFCYDIGTCCKIATAIRERKKEK